MFALRLPNERGAGLIFDEFPVRAHAALLAAITDLTRDLEAAVDARAPVRTGDLLAHIRSFVDDDETRIRGKVKVAGGPSALFAKAGALEYGAHSQVAVAAHQRLIATVFGRAVEPTTAFIGAYSRAANVPAFQFLGGSLESMRSNVEARLTAALEQAAQEAETP